MKHIKDRELFEAKKLNKKEVIEEFEELCAIFISNMIHDSSFIKYKTEIFVEKDIYKNNLTDQEDYYGLRSGLIDIKLSDKEKNAILYKAIVKEPKLTTDKNSDKELLELVISNAESSRQFSQWGFMPDCLAELYDVNKNRAIKIIKKYYKLPICKINILRIIDNEDTDYNSLWSYLQRVFSGDIFTDKEYTLTMCKLFLDEYESYINSSVRALLANKFKLVYDNLSKEYIKKDDYLKDLTKLGIFDDDD